METNVLVYSAIYKSINIIIILLLLSDTWPPDQTRDLPLAIGNVTSHLLTGTSHPTC